jgi:hypothetical protein
MQKRREKYLFGVHNIHNDASLQHASQTSLNGEVRLARSLGAALAIGRAGGEFGGHSACVIVDHLLCFTFLNLAFKKESRGERARMVL